MNKERIYETAMVLAIAGLYFFSYFQRVAVPGSIFNEIQTALDISASDVTKLSSIYLIVYASMQPFAGFLADRFGGVKVVLVSGLLLCVGSALFPFSQGEGTLYLSRALVGLGASTMFLCMAKEADYYFGGRNFTPIFGILCLIGYSGGLIATRPFRFLVKEFGWRDACLVPAVLTFVTLLVAVTVSRLIRKVDHTKKTQGFVSSVTMILKNKTNYPLLLSVPICFAIYFTIQATIGPKFLTDCCGIPTSTATNYTFVMMLCTLSSMFLSGWVSKLFGNRRKGFVIFYGAGNLAATIIFLIGISLNMPAIFFLPAFILPAIGSGFAPINISCMKEYNPPDRAAISIGVMNTFTYVMVAIMAQVTGKILDAFSAQATVTKTAVIYPTSAYITLFCVLMGVALVATIASLKCVETKGKNISAPFPA